MPYHAAGATGPGTRASVAGEAPPFAVIAIGASAGGLEAIEAFLSEVPVDCRQAFVVIQHLDPTRPALLVELLQGLTELVVEEVHQRTNVEPGHVYVIPPDRDLSIRHGVLELREAARERGINHPIDRFFRALAEDRGE